MKRTLRIIGNIFGAPSEAFTELKARPSWFTVFIIIAVVSIGIAWAILPFSEQMARTQMLESGMDAAQIQQSQAIADIFSAGGILFTPFPLLIKWLIFAGLFYLGAQFLGSPKALQFKPMYAVVVHTELILVFSNLINAALLLCFKEVGDIKDVTDLHMIPSLHLIFGDEPVGIPYFTFLRQMNPFSIWYLIVLSRGVAIVADISRKGTEWLVALTWLAGIGVQVAIAAL